LHRKNAMFFKTASGAHVGDVFMSLIHTCELSGVDPFGYLTELQRHSEELSRNPQPGFDNWGSRFAIFAAFEPVNSCLSTPAPARTLVVKTYPLEIKPKP